MFDIIRKDQIYKVRDLVVQDASGNEIAIPEEKKQMIIADAIKNNLTKIKPIADNGEKIPKLFEITFKADLQKGIENGLFKCDKDNVIVRNIKSGQIAGKGNPIEYKSQIKKGMLTKLTPTMDLAVAVAGQIQLEEIKKYLSEIKADTQKLIKYEEQKHFQILNGIAKTIFEATNPETREPIDEYAKIRINDQIHKLNDEIEIMKSRCLSEVESAYKEGYDIPTINDLFDSTFRKPENYDLKNQKAFGKTIERINAYIIFLTKANELLTQCYNVLNCKSASSNAEDLYKNSIDDIRRVTTELFYSYFKRINLNVRGLDGVDIYNFDKIIENVLNSNNPYVNIQIIDSVANTQKIFQEEAQKKIGKYTISFLMEGETNENTSNMPNMQQPS